MGPLLHHQPGRPLSGTATASPATRAAAGPGSSGYAYTLNNDGEQNAIVVLTRAADGSLTEIAGSPFATGGRGLVVPTGGDCASSSRGTSGGPVTCEEGIALLADYLEGVLSPELLRELEEHLSECPPCRAYLATYRKTRSLAADASHVEMPTQMKARLREFLLRQLREDR